MKQNSGMNAHVETLQDKGKLAVKSGIYYTIATFLSRSIGFITVPFFSRLLSKAEFSLFNSYAAWQTLLVIVIGLEGYATLNRARFDYSREELQSYQSSLSFFTVCLSLLLGTAILLVPEPFEAITGFKQKYLFLLVLYLMFYPSFNLFQTLQRVFYKYRISVSLTVFLVVSSTLTSLLFVLHFDDRLWGRMLGQYGFFIITGMACFCWYLFTGGLPKAAYLRYALPLCIPLMIASLGSQALLLGGRIVSQRICVADEAAFIALATTCTNIVLMMMYSVNNAWAPWMMDALKAGDYEEIQSKYSLLSNSLCLLVAMVALLSPELVLILGDKTYYPTVHVVPGLVCTVFFSMLVNQYISLETYEKEVRLGGFVTLAVSGLNLVLCAAFINLWGCSSIGYANCTSYIILIACHKLVLRHMGKRDAFPLRSIWKSTVGCLLIPPLMEVLFFLDLPLARYAVFIAIGCVIIFKYGKLLITTLLRK